VLKERRRGLRPSAPARSPEWRAQRGRTLQPGEPGPKRPRRRERSAWGPTRGREREQRGRARARSRWNRSRWRGAAGGSPRSPWAGSRLRRWVAPRERRGSDVCRARGRNRVRFRRREPPARPGWLQPPAPGRPKPGPRGQERRARAQWARCRPGSSGEPGFLLLRTCLFLGEARAARAAAPVVGEAGARKDAPQERPPEGAEHPGGASRGSIG
jgi:hypothetical protein